MKDYKQLCSDFTHAVRSCNPDEMFRQFSETAKLAATADAYKQQAEIAWKAADKMNSFVEDMGGGELDKRLPLTGVPFVDSTQAWPMRWAVVKESCSMFSRLYRDISTAKKEMLAALEKIKDVKY